MRERLAWINLVVIAAGGGFYAGRQNGMQAGQAQAQQVANRFFAARGGGAGAGGQGNRNGNFQAQNLVGTVDRVNGQTITVKARDNSTATIQLNADATIRKTVNGQVSDIHTGDTVIANGTRNGNVFQATSVPIGNFGGRFGPNQNQNQSAGQ